MKKNSIVAFVTGLMAISSCSTQTYKIPSKLLDDKDKETNTIIVKNKYEFYVENIESYDGGFLCNSEKMYLRTTNGFPYRYFTISNSIMKGSYFSYVAVFDYENNKYINPIYSCYANNDEMLIIYDLVDINNFSMFRYTDNSFLLYEFEPLYFNYLMFSKNINTKKLAKLEPFTIRYS